MRVSRRTAAALVASVPAALAQTSTTCNPLNSTCPQDPGLNSGSFVSDFTAGQHSSWTSAMGTTITYSDSGALFSIQRAGQAPTISTDFYFFFGRVDVTMKASPGTGIISSVVLLSDDLDELDWEFIGGNTTTVETNFFGKGNTTLYDRAIYYPVDDPQSNTHTYSIDWTSEQIQWIIDGTTVRTLPFDDPLTNGGEDYPQTPMRLRLGNWAGGGPGEPEGTVTWAGGHTNFGDAPFNMYVEKVQITNYNPADAYQYEGNSGSWQDIKIIKGDSTATPTGKGTATGSATNTKAPTSPIVVNTKHTGVAVTKTKTEPTSTSASASMSSSMSSSSSSVSSASSSPSASATTNAAANNVVFTGGSLLSVLLTALFL